MIAKYFFILFFLLIPNHAHLQPTTCDLKSIKNKLAEMKLSVTSTTNKQLLDEILFYYNDGFIDYLEEKHPELKHNPDGTIDINTLTWLEKVIHRTKTKPFRYKYFPFITEDLGEFDLLIKELVSEFGIPFFRNMPIFPGKEQATAFIQSLEADVISTMVIRLRPGLSYEMRNKFVREFIRHYQDYKNIKVGFTDLPDDPKIQIVGHGGASPMIIKSNNSHVSYNDIVTKLIELELPDQAEIELASCWSACTIADSGQKALSKAQVLAMYEAGTLLSHFLKPERNSFLKYFSKELYEKMKSFKGKVIGYAGYYHIGISDNVHKLTANGGLTLVDGVAASSMHTSDGEVKVSRKTMKVVMIK